MSDQLESLRLVALAAVLGGAIGLDREFRARPAGLRTHMLVAAAAALFTVLAEALVARYAAIYQPAGSMRVDVIPLFQAVVVGVGFLGAGTIFNPKGERVEGLTTAATILMAAGLGMTVGVRQLQLATGVTALTVVVLVTVGWAERRLERRRRQTRDD